MAARFFHAHTQKEGISEMTQWEKMVRGEPYDPIDPELTALRQRSRVLCHKLGLLSPDQIEERRALLTELLGSVPRQFSIQPGFKCDYGKNIFVGEGFFANYNLVILDCAPVTFGERVLVGPNCGFYTAIHPLDAAQRSSGQESASPITVGDDVWLGGNVTVLPGVTIGNGAVIGAGSVVTRDIPAHVLAVGNPCRVVKELT